MARGRPRKTDPKNALEAAMLVFWERGYDGTSLTDLVQATGMAKPGLYATFGDKEELYKKALTHYFDSLGTPVIKKLTASDLPARAALEEFLMAVAHSVVGGKRPAGCFVVNSASDCAHAGKDMQELSQSLNLARRQALHDFLIKAVDRGDLPGTCNTSALADFFAGQSAALAAMAQAGTGKAQLEDMVRTSLQVLPKAEVS